MNMSFVKTFKEDGTELNKILPVQEKKKDRIRIYIKFASIVLLTNIFTYLLFSTDQNNIDQNIQKNNFVIPADFTAFSLPLNVFTPLTQESTLVTILNEKNQVICEKAILIEKIEMTEEDMAMDQVSYKVLIHKKDISKVIGQGKSILNAFPFANNLKSSQRRINYEVNF